MSDFPNLEDIGVTSIDDVVKYNLTREARVDVLKIYYKRQPGSLLAQSKKFHFARGLNHVQKTTKATNFPQQAQHVAPQLLLIIEELRTLLANRPIQKKEELKESITERLNTLEAVIDSKLHRLTEQLNNLDS
ncbi:DUF3461 family protein [Gammaproteobacteria bacterium AS21]|jgi:hypothetical protein